jgi:hypothetical protein
MQEYKEVSYRLKYFSLVLKSCLDCGGKLATTSIERGEGKRAG